MVDEIIEKYKNHLTLLAIKDSFHAEKLSDLLKANAEDINKIMKSLNTCLHFCKFLKMSANTIDSHLANIISEDICSGNSND